jgi:hypothetical protein
LIKIETGVEDSLLEIQTFTVKDGQIESEKTSYFRSYAVEDKQLEMEKIDAMKKQFNLENEGVCCGYPEMIHCLLTNK